MLSEHVGSNRVAPPIPFPGPGHVETLSKKLGNPHLREDEEEGK
jgi:hypothetical protein